MRNPELKALTRAGRWSGGMGVIVGQLPPGTSDPEYSLARSRSVSIHATPVTRLVWTASGRM